MTKFSAVNHSGVVPHSNGKNNYSGAYPLFDDKVYQPASQPLRILMTTDTIGGVWTYSLELAQAFTLKDHHIMLATMGAPLTTKQRCEVEQIPHLHTCESNFKVEWMDDPWADIDQAGRWLLQLEQEFQPDVIHLNGYAHGALPWSVPTLMVGHSCVSSWWQAVKNEPPPSNWARYRRYVRRGLQAADMVLAPTQAMLNALKYHYGPLARSQVVPNGRNPNLFWNGPKASFIFTASRVWDQAKNITALEAVAPYLRWPIYVAGEDKHPSGGSVQLHSLNLLGRLSFEELLPWFAQASIYALPARYEPFGLSALEAAMAGCALVLGNIPSLREVWGDAALYVAPDNIQELEIALALLIADPHFRQIMAQKAYRRARQFTSESMAANYLSVYQQLIQSVGLRI